MGAPQRGSLIPGLTGWHVVWSPAEVNRFLSGAMHDVTRHVLILDGFVDFRDQLGKKKTSLRLHVVASDIVSYFTTIHLTVMACHRK